MYFKIPFPNKINDKKHIKLYLSLKHKTDIAHVKKLIELLNIHCIEHDSLFSDEARHLLSLDTKKLVLDIFDDNYSEKQSEKLNKIITQYGQSIEIYI